MSAYIVRKFTNSGQRRFHVMYRLGAKRGKVLYAGAFKTREEADIRLTLVRKQLAAGATTIRLTDIPDPDVGRWVYFVRHGENGPIKIGSARNVANRLRYLQAGNPVQLNLVAVVPCHGDEEKRLHASFGHARLNGEWFRPTPDLLSYIAEFEGEAVEWENGLEVEA